MYEKISKLIEGKLSETESDQLWQEFVKDPKLFNYYKTELGLRSTFQKSVTQPISTTKVTQLKSTLLALAALVLLASGVGYYSWTTQQSQKEIDLLLAVNPYDIENFKTLRTTNPVDGRSEISVNEATTDFLLDRSDRALSIYDSLVNTVSLSNEMKARVHFNRSLVHYKNGSYDESKRDLLLAKELSSHNDLQLKSEWYLLRIDMIEGNVEATEKRAQHLREVAAGLSPQQQKLLDIILD